MKKRTGKMVKPGVNHRTKAQREIDRLDMVKMLKRGMTKADIADKLGLHPSMITYDFKLIISKVRSEMSLDTQDWISRKLAEYAEVKAEAWAAWERSKEDAQRTTEEATSGGDDGRGERQRSVHTKEGRLPGAQYLNVIKDCLEAERELLGLNPAKKVEGTLTAVGVIDFDDLMRRAEEKRSGRAIEARILGVTAGPPADADTHEGTP